MAVGVLKTAILKTGFGQRVYEKKTLHELVYQYRLKENEIKAVEENRVKISQVLPGHLKMHAQKAKEINVLIDYIFATVPVEDKDETRQDMLFCYFAYGFTPSEYVCYRLAEKKPGERKKFISDRESVIYGHRINDLYARKIFSDKVKTYERFKEFYHREAVCIKEDRDYEKFVDFITKYPVFVKKNVFESCGRSVELVDATQYAGRERELFDTFIHAGKTILEEKVVQSSTMSLFCSSSVNTVRCFTLNTRTGIIVPWCFMKVGRNGSFVDNGGAGGILIGLDIEKGLMNTDGVDEYGRRYEHHPESKVTFKGFQLPQWDEMISLCKKMALMEPEVRWIGWDMAHTENGWVVIEGNALSEVIGPQSTALKGIREELDRYIKDVKLLF